MTLSMNVLVSLLATSAAAHASSDVQQPPAYFYATADAEEIRVHVAAEPGELDGDGAPPSDGLLGPDDAQVPERLTSLEFGVVALAGEGGASLDRVGFEPQREGTASWWSAVHKRTATTKKATGLAIANPVGDPKLRSADPVKIKSADGEQWALSIATVLAEELQPLDRRRLGKKVLSQSRVSVFPGTFANDGAALVVVNVPLRNKDPEAPARTIRGMFTLQADGTLATMLVAPLTDTETLQVEALGDVDADGQDDVVWSRTRDGSTRRRLLRWEDGVPTEDQLAGPLSSPSAE